MEAPNEVLITSVSAIETIHGSRSTATKQHTFYDLMNYRGIRPLISLNDRGDHRERRKIWDLALSTKNMETYELNARRATRVWLQKVEVAVMARDSLDLSRCISLVSLDNMTRTGFSLASETLDPQATDRLIHLMEANFVRIAASGHSVWPLFLMSKLGLLKEEGQFDKLTYGMTLVREVCFSEDLYLYRCIYLTNPEQFRSPQRSHAILPR